MLLAREPDERIGEDKAQEKLFIGWESVEIESMPTKIAFSEKALVDMIHFRKGKYAVDLVIEKILNYSDELEKEKIIQYASFASQKTVKIFGLVFDLLGLDSDQLYQYLAGNTTLTGGLPRDPRTTWRQKR